MSKVVFVGNVPYNMGEEQLIDVFKTVGQVIGFRLVFDRETGKPRGYGFCEFADHETALSAVRNLNNVDVGGRPLRIDLADSDPFLEGKTTVRGELLDGGETRAQWRERERDRRDDYPRGLHPVLEGLPAGVPLAPGVSALDAISQTLAKMSSAQLTEVLAQMKAFVINRPDDARHLLIAHPQLAYALFQALLLNKIVDSSVLQKMLAATGQAGPRPPPTQQPHYPLPMEATPTGPSIPTQPPVNYYQQPPPMQQAPPPPQQHQQVPVQHPMYGYSRPPSVPAPAPIASVPMHTPAPHVSAPLPPHAAAPAAPQPSPLDNIPKEMIMQVASLSDEAINALSPPEREAIRQLKNQIIAVMPGLITS